MLSSLRRFLNEFNDRFTSETLDFTSGSNYATLFHQPVDRIHYILTLFSHRVVEWLSMKVCMYVLVRCMWSCMFGYGHLHLYVCMYVAGSPQSPKTSHARRSWASYSKSAPSGCCLPDRSYSCTYIHTCICSYIFLWPCVSWTSLSWRVCSG